MGRFFKIVDHTKPEVRTLWVDAPRGSQKLYSEIEDIVGMKPNPSNDIPFALEVDGWGELACIEDFYVGDDFYVVCITEEDFKDGTDS